MIQKGAFIGSSCAVIGILAAWCIIFLPAVGRSQNALPDTVGANERDVIYMGDVTVNASRLPLTVLEIPASATSLRIGTIERSLSSSIGALVNSLPGVQAYPISNPWGAASVNTRGFYGGAQADYLMVTYDGIPMNDIASGRVPWSLLSSSEVGIVESIMGPASAQYGDFGFGGLLALYSPSIPAGPHYEFTSAGGSYGAWRAHTSASYRLSSFAGSLMLSKRQNEGWRDHSRYKAENAGFVLDKTFGPRFKFSSVVSGGHTYEQYPGAITGAELQQDRSAAADIFGMKSPDYSDADDFRGCLSATYGLGSKSEAKSLVYLSSTNSSEVLTVTRPVRHDPRVTSTGTDFTFGLRDTLLGRSAQMVAGVHGEYGELRSKYREFGADGVIRDGHAFRRAVAAYFHGLYSLPENIALSAGIRVDKLWSDYRSSVEKHEQHETAVSPKFGVSVPVHGGVQMYASVAGAFKAPTLIHLYDSPPIYYEFSPGAGDYFGISNADLKAQTGTCYEFGCKFVDSLGTAARLSLFDYEISDEIDFDAATNKYMNIGKSRHQGIETALRHRFLSFLTGDATLEYNSTTFRTGAYRGNQINGVPKFVYNLGLTYERPDRYFASFMINGRGSQFIDQDNTRKIGEYATADAALGISIRGIEFGAAMHNIFNRAYVYDGYVGLMTESRFYPAPGRTVYVSLSTRI